MGSQRGQDLPTIGILVGDSITPTGGPLCDLTPQREQTTWIAGMEAPGGAVVGGQPGHNLLYSYHYELWEAFQEDVTLCIEKKETNLNLLYQTNITLSQKPVQDIAGKENYRLISLSIDILSKALPN